MKTVTKFVIASVLALSAVAPALAAEEDTLLERNTYLFTPDARPITQHVQANRARAHRAVDAMANEPAGTTAGQAPDLGIGSQS